MYDQLVLPIPPPYEQNEINRWENAGWDPSLLNRRLEKLGNIAIKVPWDLEHQIIFGRQMRNVEEKSETLNLTDEAKEVIPYQSTRLILSQEQQSRLQNEGYNIYRNVIVLPAYHSIADFQADKFLLQENQKGDQDINNQQLGVLLRHKIIVPTDINPENALDTAVRLANRETFKAARQELYAWQEDIISRGFSVGDAATRLDELLRQYNNQVREATNRYVERLLYTVARVGLNTLRTVVSPDGLSVYDAADSILSVVEFARTEHRDVEPGESKPAAMLYEANRVLEGNWLMRVKRSLYQIF
jgi:hypothetical protein